MKLYEIEKANGSRAKYKTLDHALQAFQKGDRAIYEGEWVYPSDYGLNSHNAHSVKKWERKVYEARTN